MTTKALFSRKQNRDKGWSQFLAGISTFLERDGVPVYREGSYWT